MIVKIKKLHEKAVIPTYSKKGDAGLDLTAVGIYQPQKNEDGSGIITYSTGLSVEIPEGYVGLLFPRSSIAETSLTLANCVGVIDSGYRGEIAVRFRITSTFPTIYQPGDRIAQLIIIPYPMIGWEVSEELSQTERGENGFGSTNNKINENDGNEGKISEGDTEVISSESGNDNSTDISTNDSNNESL